MTAVPASPTSSMSSTSSGALQEIDPVTAQQWLASGKAALIDVREADEYNREHIDGARLAPLSRFDPNVLNELKGKKIIIHCKGGTRGKEACRLSVGIAEVHNLTGGIEAWKKANLPVVVNAKAPGISVMRQVQLVIGAGVLAGTALGVFVSPWWLGLDAFFGSGLIFAGASGTCGMAAVLARMPWNKVSGGDCSVSHQG